jgi:hypothetical protein
MIAARHAGKEDAESISLAFTLGFSAVFAVATVALILYGGA